MEPGRVTGFLGPNGAGKTTTLRMLLDLVEPTAGTATIGGVRYADLDQPIRRVGAVRGNNPDGDFPWDDTKRYVDRAPLTAEGRDRVFELNARRVYPRLDAALTARGA